MTPQNCHFFEQMQHFISIFRQPPSAIAKIRGSVHYPNISGEVTFHQTSAGVLVSAQVTGLPTSDDTCAGRIFAFHIHSGGTCTGNANDPFADALAHYNPYGCEHPHHAGDLPPLFGNHGYAFAVFLTDRFSISEVIGKTVVIHSNPDDFTSQPSGSAGEKIACGEIKKIGSLLSCYAR
ncbi:MAG: superoxide dismutase family protein [Eubacteriales bacterium]|nr:superoxide dismutase family protein [Eubacteriales bacterium]